MNVRDKYALGDLLSEGEVKTYAARDLASGESVFVHNLGAAKADLMTLVVRRMRSTSLGGSSGVLDMFEADGEVYLITEVIPGFTRLRTWLEPDAASTPAPQPSSLPTAPERTQPSSPEALTGRAAGPAATPNPSPNIAGASQPPRVDQDAQTSVFASPRLSSAPNQRAAAPPSTPNTPAAPPLAPAPPRAAPPASSEPGEFTRLFDPASLRAAQPVPPPPSPPSPSWPPPVEPGLPKPSAKPEPRAPVAPPPTATPDSAPGEFTQLFRPSRGDEFIGEPPSAPHFPVRDFDRGPQQPGEFTQLFQPSFGDSAVSPDEPLPSVIASSAERDEPGVLTRILRPDRDSLSPPGGGSLASEPLGAPSASKSSEPGFDTLFGSVRLENPPAGARETSGTSIFSAPPPASVSEPPVPQAPAVPPPAPPEPPAPPTYGPRESVAQPQPASAPPKPVLPVSLPRPPAVPPVPSVPVLHLPSAGAPASSPPVLGRPPVPAAPRLPTMPKPSPAPPPSIPKAPVLKPPATSKLRNLPSASAAKKPGPSTLAMVLVLGGLALVVVAVILLLK